MHFYFTDRNRNDCAFFFKSNFSNLIEKNLSEMLHWRKIPSFLLLKCVLVKVPTKTLNNK